MSATQWWVWGGVFADGQFDRLEPGEKEELIGPFDDRAAAERAAVEGMRRKVDTCWHRLMVRSTEELAASRAAATQARPAA